MTSWKKWSDKKILLPEQLEEKVHALKSQNKKIVTLNGSFDLLHAGHLYILHEASQQGDLLIVAVNSDLSVRAYKGPHKPIISLPHRMELLTALACVDYVTWFDESDPRAILSKIQPHVHVNGAEYGIDCIESEVVKQGGGEIYLVDRIPHLATSEIIKKIIHIERSCV